MGAWLVFICMFDSPKQRLLDKIVRILQASA